MADQLVERTNYTLLGLVCRYPMHSPRPGQTNTYLSSRTLVLLIDQPGVGFHRETSGLQ
jgi:hypothetical protein